MVRSTIRVPLFVGSAALLLFACNAGDIFKPLTGNYPALCNWKRTAKVIDEFGRSIWKTRTYKNIFSTVSISEEDGWYILAAQADDIPELWLDSWFRSSDEIKVNSTGQRDRQGRPISRATWQYSNQDCRAGGNECIRQRWQGNLVGAGNKEEDAQLLQATLILNRNPDVGTTLRYLDFACTILEE